MLTRHSTSALERVLLNLPVCQHANKYQGAAGLLILLLSEPSLFVNRDSFLLQNELSIGDLFRVKMQARVVHKCEK